MKFKNFKSACILFVTFCLCVLTCTGLFAQNDTISTGGASGVPFFLIAFLKSWGAIILGAYEAFVRIIPTAKSWSILVLLLKVLDFLGLGDKSSAGGNHDTLLIKSDLEKKKKLKKKNV
jgi:hypothetical protein